MKLLLGAGIALMASGCATAWVIKPDVTGPHGEHLIELSCALPDRCMDLAREQCGGDFDLVSNNDSTWNIGRVVSSSSVMLVHCQHEPPPRTAQVAPPPPEPEPEPMQFR